MLVIAIHEGKTMIIVTVQYRIIMYPYTGDCIVDTGIDFGVARRLPPSGLTLKGRNMFGPPCFFLQVMPFWHSR